MLGRDAAARMRLDVILHPAHEGASTAAGVAQFILQHLDQRRVAGEEDRGRGRRTACARHGEIVDEMRMDEAQAHQRLARTRHAGQQHEAAGAGPRGLMDDLRHHRDRAVGRRRGAMHAPQTAAIVEELARRAHQRGQRPVGLGAEKGTDIDRRVGTALLQLRDQLVERIGAADMHAPLHAAIAPHARRHEDRDDGAAFAGRVVAAQVARIGIGLVQIGVARARPALELDHQHARAQQQDRVGPAAFQRQLIFQDRRETARGGVDMHDLADLVLETRHTVGPGTDLLGRGVAHEQAQAVDDGVPRLGPEGAEIGCPSGHGLSKSRWPRRRHAVSPTRIFQPG